MIVRLLVKVMTVVGVVTLLATAAAGTVGRFFETEVAITVASRGNGLIRLIDLDRRMRFDMRVPMQRIVDITLEPDRPTLALVMTYQPNDRQFQRALYVFDLETQELHLLAAANRERRNPGDLRSYYRLTWSPDGEKLAFYDPDDSGLYITDLATYTTRHVAELTTVARLVWAPDSSQIAVPQSTDALFIVNADGGHPRLFSDLEPGGFSLAWSADSQWIVLSQSVERMDAIRVIDPGDGEVHPQTAALEGREARWWCDRLVYVASEGDQSQTWVMDLETGNRTNLQTNPVLAGVEVDGFWGVTGICDWLFIRGRPPSNAGRLAGLPTYLSDATGSTARLISETMWLISVDDASETLYYVSPDDIDRWSVYKLVLDDQPEPEAILTGLDLGESFMPVSSPASGGEIVFISITTTAYRLAMVNIRSGSVEYRTLDRANLGAFVLWE